MPRIKSAHLLSTVLVLIFAFSLLTVWKVQSLFSPVASGADITTKEIKIPVGSSTAHIASILQEEGLIKNAFLFRFLSRYKGYDELLKAGKYQLSTSMSMQEILLELQKGIIPKEGIRFTIPEGFTIEQISSRLEEKGLCKKEIFLEVCRNYEGDSTNLFSQIIDTIPPQVHYLLEGYLFPDTYEVYQDVQPEEIVELMLSRFFEVFNEDYRLRAQEMGLGIHQVVTIASLIEKEAVLPEERPLIAAVFHNRLNSEALPLLQSCATVQYILGETKPVLSNQDLEIDSPFNTYLYPDLPPGPIASPGLQSLQAALYPADVDYLYFVSKEDGSGSHYFSRTLREHNNYKNLAQRNRRQ